MNEKPPSGNEETNNEGSPKTPYVEMAKEFYEGIIKTISDFQESSLYPQNFEQYKNDAEIIYNQTIIKINDGIRYGPTA